MLGAWFSYIDLKARVIPNLALGVWPKLVNDNPADTSETRTVKFPITPFGPPTYAAELELLRYLVDPWRARGSLEGLRNPEAVVPFAQLYKDSQSPFELDPNCHFLEYLKAQNINPNRFLFHVRVENEIELNGQLIEDSRIVDLVVIDDNEGTNFAFTLKGGSTKYISRALWSTLNKDIPILRQKTKKLTINQASSREIQIVTQIL